MNAARRWESLSWALFVLGAFPVLFAGHALMERDLAGALTSLVPAIGCGLFGYFARMRHDRIIFGTPTPRWLVVACASMGAVVLVMVMLGSMERAEVEARRDAAEVRSEHGVIHLDPDVYRRLQRQ